jgi:hypothetical protein
MSAPGPMFLTILGMDLVYRKQRSSKNCALEFLGQAEQETIPVHKQKDESHKNNSPPQQKWNNRVAPRVEISWNSTTRSVNQGLGNCI